MTNASRARHGRSTAAVAALVVLVAGALNGCGGDQPVTPRTTTITITPTPSGTAKTASGSTTTTTTTAALAPPTSYDQAMQHFATGTVDAGSKTTFTSPTGNIYCSISPEGAIPAGCELRDGRAAPKPNTCDAAGAAKDVGRIEWSGDTPKAVCNTDTMISPGAQVLQYGSIARAQGSPFECLSETIGMTCVNRAGKKGFFMAKGTYTIF